MLASPSVALSGVPGLSKAPLAPGGKVLSQGKGKDNSGRHGLGKKGARRLLRKDD